MLTLAIIELVNTRNTVNNFLTKKVSKEEVSILVGLSRVDPYSLYRSIINYFLDSYLKNSLEKLAGRVLENDIVK